MQALSNILLLIHSYWRWVVVVLLLVTFIKMLIGWVSRSGWGDLDTNLTKWLGMSLGIQFLLGLLVLILNVVTVGTAYIQSAAVIEHTVSNFIAVILGSLSFKRAPVTTRFRNKTIALLLAVVFIYRAVAVVGGW